MAAAVAIGYAELTDTGMKKATALQFTAPATVTMCEVEVPDPGHDEVAITMLATSLCNQSELRSFRGGSRDGYGSRYPMEPGEPGHEGVGIVSGVGRGVETIREGDVVALTGWGGVPAHRSFLTRQSSEVALLRPGERDPRPASILEMYASAYHCIKAAWRECENARVAVVGMGAIGLCSVQILNLWPVGEVVAFDPADWKLELASRLGAGAVCTVDPDGDAGAVAAGAGSFDVVVECTGAASGQALALAMAPRSLVNVSYVSSPVTVDQTRWFDAGTTVYNPGLPRSADLRAVAGMYNRGLLDPEMLVTIRLQPAADEYTSAVRRIQRGEIVKALMVWS